MAKMRKKGLFLGLKSSKRVDNRIMKEISYTFLQKDMTIFVWKLRGHHSIVLINLLTVIALINCKSASM